MLVSNPAKKLDGPTQMSRARARMATAPYLNTAQGNGGRQERQRTRFFDDAPAASPGAAEKATQ